MVELKRNLLITRKEKDRLERKALIVQSAERVFLNKNFHNATIDDIARDAELSVGTIYNFFQNKENLFIEVIKKISLELLDGLQRSALKNPNQDLGLEQLIRLRISNFERHKLFLQLFFDKNSPAFPDFGKLPKEITDSYHQYLESLGDFLATICQSDFQRDFYPVYLALSFEGFISAFMGYKDQANRNESLAKAVLYVRQMFSGQLFTKQSEGNGSMNMNNAVSLKEIFITKYDLARLTDLIIVSRSFSQGYADVHLRNLARELNRAKIVDSQNAPADVVTMNSKVRLVEQTSQQELIVTLVFPSDSDGNREKLSILDPLGTALIGYRVGDSFDVNQGDGTRTYRIEDLLYQPESAGHFSL